VAPRTVGVARRGWLDRNVLAIGLADCMADFNYEMVLAVLPLFLTTALVAPIYTVALLSVWPQPAQVIY
jgi:hypothetical protein